MKSLNTLITTLTLGVLMGMGGAFASEEVNAIERMVNAGVSDDVVKAYVDNSNESYTLTSDDIVRLERENVSDGIILELINHGQILNTNDGSSGTLDSAALLNSNLNTPSDSTPVAFNPQSDLAPTPAPVPEPPVTVPQSSDMNLSFFYQALAPDGTWCNDPNYGWVWTPNVAVTQSDWRPYAQDGHWTYTDQGWYWESSYNWSWAAFHYGRWTHGANQRWVWVPDTHWAPAWVNFREGNDCYGWAPLPPEARFDDRVGLEFHGNLAGRTCDFGLRDADYTFVASDRFLASNISSCALPPTRVKNVFNISINIGNTYVYNNNRIINQGLPLAQVQTAVHQTIRPVKLSDATVSGGQRIPHEQLSGDKLVTFRPQIAAKAPVTPPVIQARRADEQQKREAAHQKVLDAVAQRKAEQTQKQQDRTAKLDAQRQTAQAARAEQQKQVADKAAAAKAAQEQRQAQAREHSQQQAQARAEAQRQAQATRAEQQKQAADKAAATKAAQEQRQAQAREQAQQQAQARAEAQRQAQTARAEQQKQAADKAAATKAAQEQRQAQAREQAQQQAQARAEAQRQAQATRAEQQKQAADKAAATKAAQEQRQVQAREQAQQQAQARAEAQRQAQATRAEQQKQAADKAAATKAAQEQQRAEQAQAAQARRAQLQQQATEKAAATKAAQEQRQAQVREQAAQKQQERAAAQQAAKAEAQARQNQRADRTHG